MKHPVQKLLIYSVCVDISTDEQKQQIVPIDLYGKKEDYPQTSLGLKRMMYDANQFVSVMNMFDKTKILVLFDCFHFVDENNNVIWSDYSKEEIEALDLKRF